MITKEEFWDALRLPVERGCFNCKFGSPDSGRPRPSVDWRGKCDKCYDWSKDLESKEHWEYNSNYPDFWEE